MHCEQNIRFGYFIYTRLNIKKMIHFAEEILKNREISIYRKVHY